MPKKIRELKAMLRKAGFKSRPGKGGKDGSDAKPYQEREVADAIQNTKGGE